MQPLIRVEEVPFVDQEQAAIKTTFESPGYLLLKELLGACAVKAQSDAINKEPYSGDNPDVAQLVAAAKSKACTYAAFLDALDDIERNPAMWLRVKLEQRH